MKNILLIIQKEFLIRVRSKAFIIITLLGPVILLAFIFLIKTLNEKNKKEFNIVVYDETKLIQHALSKQKGVNYHFVEKGELKGIKENIIEKKWDGLLYIPMPKSGNMSAIETNIQFHYNSTPSISIIEKIKKDLNDRIMELKLLKQNITMATIHDAKTNVIVNLVNFNEQKKKDSILVWQIRAVIGGVLGVIIYLFIFIYGTMIMKNILHEKTSRVVEVILSSVRSFDLMMGKIISNVLAGILQFAVWILGSSILFVVIKNSLGIVRLNTQLPNQVQGAKYAVNSVNDIFFKNLFEAIDMMNFSVIIFIFIILFILGYLFYSSIFAVIGAIVDSENDTQQFILPITFPLLLSIYLGQTILDNPNGDVAFWMSIIPFSSPEILMARIPFGVPYWQMFLSVGILIVSVLIMVYFGGKLYKRGVINYGKSYSYKDLFNIIFKNIFRVKK